MYIQLIRHCPHLLIFLNNGLLIEYSPVFEYTFVLITYLMAFKIKVKQVENQQDPTFSKNVNTYHHHAFDELKYVFI